MPGPTLRALLSPRSGSLPALTALLDASNADICIFDLAGKGLLGVPSTEASADYARVPVQFENSTLGFVTGPSAPATAVAPLLTHLAARESEGRALASEILHLYREVHLIEQLSEQLAALLDLSAVSQSALGQAQRLIAATHGGTRRLPHCHCRRCLRKGSDCGHAGGDDPRRSSSQDLA